LLRQTPKDSLDR